MSRTWTPSPQLAAQDALCASGRSRGLGVLGRARRFARDESGAVTVEAVIWIPFFFGILMMITDVSLAFFGKAEAFRLIQDVNRAVSIGTIPNAATARAVLLEAFDERSPNATAEVRVANGFVRTVLTIPSTDLVLFTDPFLVNFNNLTFEVGAQHFMEDATS